MSISVDRSAPSSPIPHWLSGHISYLWIHVLIAAILMIATLPGRTHGLGIITEQLMKDLEIDRLQYADINLWATLIGAMFCVPCGWLLDRFGPRLVMPFVLLGLGGTVLWMSSIQKDWGIITLPGSETTFALGLFLLIFLTRALGQSALSVVSLSLKSQSTGRQAGVADGVYSFLIAVGFSLAFLACRNVPTEKWRLLWECIGWIVLGLAVVLPLLVRPSALFVHEKSRSESKQTKDGSWTLGQALKSRVFWVFAITTSLYGGVSSGIGLFNQDILQERGFGREVYLDILQTMPFVGLASNLLTGWLITRYSLNKLLSAAMFLMAIALLMFPFVESLAQVYLYAGAMALVGGMITVLFFAVWAKAFGLTHLGSIMGVAQMLTVFGSALGPLPFAAVRQNAGSYSPMFFALAPVCAVLALIAWWTPVDEKRLPPS